MGCDLLTSSPGSVCSFGLSAWGLGAHTAFTPGCSTFSSVSPLPTTPGDGLGPSSCLPRAHCTFSQDVMPIPHGSRHHPTRKGGRLCDSKLDFQIPSTRYCFPGTYYLSVQVSSLKMVSLHTPLLGGKAAEELFTSGYSLLVVVLVVDVNNCLHTVIHD